MKIVLVSTTEHLPGYEVRTIIGPVLGVCAHSSSPYDEGLKSLADGHTCAPGERLSLLAGHRSEAVRHMLERAWEIGANAVIAMRFDHRNVTKTWNEICAYGTAVWVEPVRDAADLPRQATARR